MLLFDLSFDILVSFEELVVLGLSDLQPLVEVGLQLLLESVHFVLLLGNEFGLGSNDFLLPLVHVFFTLNSFHLLALDLHLVGLLIAIEYRLEKWK